MRAIFFIALAKCTNFFLHGISQRESQWFSVIARFFYYTYYTRDGSVECHKVQTGFEEKNHFFRNRLKKIHQSKFRAIEVIAGMYLM